MAELYDTVCYNHNVWCDCKNKIYSRQLEILIKPCRFLVPHHHGSQSVSLFSVRPRPCPGHAEGGDLHNAQARRQSGGQVSGSHRD